MLLTAAEGVAYGVGAIGRGGGRRSACWCGVGLIVEWIENDEAAGDVSGGGGGQAGLAEEEMEQAAFAGVHGREGVGPAGGADAFDGGVCAEAEFALALHFEVGGVEVDLIVLLGLEADDLGCKVLDGVEELGVAMEEEWSVGAGEFDAEVRSGRGRVGGRARGGAGLGLHLAVAGRDFEVEVQTPGGLEDLEEGLDLLFLEDGIRHGVPNLRA